MKKLFLLLSLVFLFNLNFAQQIYLSVNNHILRLSEDGAIEYLNSISDLPTLFDIAMGPDGAFYGVLNNELYKLNIEEGTSDLLGTIPSTGSFSGLVCSADGYLYTLSSYYKNLYRYHLASGTFEWLDTLEYDTPGDLTFYKGYLIFPTDKEIFAYSLESRELTRIYCLNDDVYYIWGFSTLFDGDCEASQKVLSSDASNNFWEFQLQESDSSYWVDVSTLGDAIFGMTSSTESFASACPEGEIYPVLDCEMSTNENTTKPIVSIHPNPVQSVLNLNSDQKIKYVEIIDVHGRKIFQKENPSVKIDVSLFPNGFYILNAVTPQGPTLIKFIKN